MIDTGFAPPPAPPHRPKGVRVVASNGATGIAYEQNPAGTHRWVKLDSGNSAWLEQTRLQPIDDPDAFDHRPKPPPVKPVPTFPCGCPAPPGTVMLDQAKHDAFHALVVEQGGPAGVVNAASLRAARGMAGTIASSALDARNQRTGKSSPGWLREASR